MQNRDDLTNDGNFLKTLAGVLSFILLILMVSALIGSHYGKKEVVKEELYLKYEATIYNNNEEVQRVGINSNNTVEFNTYTLTIRDENGEIWYHTNLDYSIVELSANED